jgi:hypothetical protein
MVLHQMGVAQNGVAGGVAQYVVLQGGVAPNGVARWCCSHPASETPPKPPGRAPRSPALSTMPLRTSSPWRPQRSRCPFHHSERAGSVGRCIGCDPNSSLRSPISVGPTSRCLATLSLSDCEKINRPGTFGGKWRADRKAIFLLVRKSHRNFLKNDALGEHRRLLRDRGAYMKKEENGMPAAPGPHVPWATRPAPRGDSFPQSRTS